MVFRTGQIIIVLSSILLAWGKLSHLRMNWLGIASQTSQSTDKNSSQAFNSFDEYFNRAGPWDDKNLDPIFEANKAWVQKMKVDSPDFFRELRKGHAPKILWIGCSDARVPANEIIGEPPGSVFVHRNIANMVVNTDFNCMSVIQYAVDVLQVKHIIVCGHYDCGGIRASLELKDHKSPLENWLRNIRDTFRLHKTELMAITDLVARNRRLVELNVIEQCVNVFKTAVVQRKRVETYLESIKEGSTTPFVLPRIHALVYEPGTGELQRLHVDFKSYMQELRDVYDLYRVEHYLDAPDGIIPNLDGSETELLK